LGLNITSASRVILYDLTWNPVHDQQAVGRAYRLGQKNHVFVYRLATFGTYEQTFFTENVFKLNLSKRVIDQRQPGRFGVSKDKNLERYFAPIKDEKEANAIDESQFEKGVDKILDRLLQRSKSGEGPKILQLDPTNTFHKEEEEIYLSPEDELAANAQAKREKQLREEGRYFEINEQQVHQNLGRALFPETMGPPERNDGLTPEQRYHLSQVHRRQPPFPG
jgi:Helicase conserved C-terminal domain